MGCHSSYSPLQHEYPEKLCLQGRPSDNGSKAETQAYSIYTHFQVKPRIFLLIKRQYLSKFWEVFPYLFLKGPNKANSRLFHMVAVQTQEQPWEKWVKKAWINTLHMNFTALSEKIPWLKTSQMLRRLVQLSNASPLQSEKFKKTLPTKREHTRK